MATCHRPGQVAGSPSIDTPLHTHAPGLCCVPASISPSWHAPWAASSLPQEAMVVDGRGEGAPPRVRGMEWPCDSGRPWEPALAKCPSRRASARPPAGGSRLQSPALCCLGSSGLTRAGVLGSPSLPLPLHSNPQCPPTKKEAVCRPPPPPLVPPMLFCPCSPSDSLACSPSCCNACVDWAPWGQAALGSF